MSWRGGGGRGTGRGQTNNRIVHVAQWLAQFVISLAVVGC